MSMRTERMAADAAAPGPWRDFQPALIALQQRPPNPLGRKVLWGLAGFLGLVLAGACIGRVDVVAVAHGKLVPAGYLKIVQPAEPGILSEILVREGDAVRQGQVLMRMDAALAEADGRALVAEHRALQWQLQRIDAELSDRMLAPPTGATPLAAYQQALAQYHSNRQTLQAALAQEQGQLDKAEQDLAAAEAVRSKLQQLLPTYQEQEAAYARLAEKGYVSKMDQLQRQRERIEAEQSLRAQDHAMQAAQALLTQSRRRRDQILADYRRRLQAERAEAVVAYAKIGEELAKQQTLSDRLALTAPYDGIVKDVSTHTIGTVVGAGTVLMTVVPQTDRLVAEVWVSNEDAGFVREGQPVKLKLLTYSFQKYGMVDGTVAHLSADASPQSNGHEGGEPGARGESPLAYRAVVHLSRQMLIAGRGQHKLAPGMQVTAEIRLGTRRVIDYLLSPVQGAFQEAGRER